MKKLLSLKENKKFLKIKDIVMLSCITFLTMLFVFNTTAFFERSSALTIFSYYAEDIIIFALGINYLFDSIFIKRQLNLIHIILFILVIPTFIFTNDINMILLLIMVISYSNFKTKTFLNFIFLGLLISYFITLIYTAIGLFPNVVIDRGVNWRYSLGLDYPIITQYLVFVLISIYIYEKGLKITYLELLALTIFNIVIFLFDDSRTDFLLSLVLIFLVLAYKLYMKFSKKTIDFNSPTWLRILISLLPVYLTIGYILLALWYRYDLPFSEKLNTLLSNRLILTNRAFDNYNVLTPFGQHMEFNFGYVSDNTIIRDDTYFFIDCTYLYTLFCYGFVSELISFYMIGKTIYISMEKKNYLLSILCVLFLIDAFFEQFFIKANGCFIILFTGEFLTNEKLTLNIKFKGQN